MPSLFEKIANREIPAEFVHEDEVCFAIRDIQPQAPCHILVIPKKAISRLAEAEAGDSGILGHLLTIASRIASSEGLSEGFRVVINNGPDGGESVPHLHVHLLGGRPMAWPPG